MALPCLFLFQPHSCKVSETFNHSTKHFFFRFIFVWKAADWLLDVKSPPALVHNSLILLCPRNQLLILIGCLSLALPNDIFTMAMADEGVLHLSHTLIVIASLFSPLLNKPLWLSFTMILISFHSPQSYLRKHLRRNEPFFLQCHFPIFCCIKSLLSTVQMGC